MTMEIAEVLDLEVVLGEVLDVVHLPFKLDGGEGLQLMIQLNFEGIDVVGVQVSVAQSVNELTSFEA
jgi:hypothetical protein